MSQYEMENKDLLPDRDRNCIFAATAAAARHNQQPIQLILGADIGGA